jgi:hypothetical protein
LVRKLFSVANEHEKLKCHNDKSITIWQINLTVLRYPKPLGQSIFKYLSFKRGRILCLLFKSRRDLTPMSLHLLFRNGSDLMSIYKHKVWLAAKQFLLLPPSIYLCLGLWSGLHCPLECFIPMGGGHFQNMWDSAITSF